MIQAESDPHRRDEYLQKLMELPNQVGFGLISLPMEGEFARAGAVRFVDKEQTLYSSEM